MFGYDGPTKIVLKGSGSGGFDELKSHLTDDTIAFCFVRFITGDEESKRAKFVFLSWCGEKVKALARAKLSVHKASTLLLYLC
jgi:hypothetical protein